MHKTWVRGATFAFVLVLLVVVAAGCGEQQPTATVSESPSPSPSSTAKPATATPLPTAAATPTPTSTPTPTPPTPTPLPTFTPVPTVVPTPTPTPEESKLELISQFDWYRSTDVDQAQKDSLTEDLCYLAEAYPDLFDALLERYWTTSSHYATDVEVLAAVLGFLTGTTRSYESDAVAMQILSMPFLNDLDEVDLEILSVFDTFAQRGEERVQSFLDQLTADGVVVDNYNLVDVFYPYVKANEPEIEAWLDEHTDREGASAWATSYLARLGVLYPEVFWALAETFAESYISPTVSERATIHASIDVETAKKVASMGVMAAGGYSSRTWEVLIAATRIDPAAANEILDRYSAFDIVWFPELPHLVLQLMPLVNPWFTETLDGLAWYRDGIPEVRATERNLDTGRREFQETTHEGWVLLYMFREAFPERTELFDKLAETDWLSDDEITESERIAAGRLAAHHLPNIAVRLLDMQFLDDISGEEVAALDALSDSDYSRWRQGDPLLDEVLSHARIGGELTDSNLRYVQEAIEEAEERIERD